MSLLGASLITSERGHMNIPVVVERMPQAMKKGFSIFAEIVAFVFSAVILVYGGMQITSLAMGQMTSSLGVAIVFTLYSPLSGVLNMIYTAMNIYDIVRETFLCCRPARRYPGRKSGKGGSISYGNPIFSNYYFVLAVFLVAGVPISYAIGISALAAILQMVSLDIRADRGAENLCGMSKFSLTAIPFSSWRATLMNQGNCQAAGGFVLAILGKLPGAFW